MLFVQYRRERHALSLQEMQYIHEELERAAENGDSTIRDLYRDLLGASVRYAKIRADWPMLTREQKIDADVGRTIAHDALITKFNVLARYCAGKNMDVSWRMTLGDEESDPAIRKRIGDMGCFLAFMEALSAR